MNVLHIAWRELRATFTTPVGWLVLCGWLLVTGLFWVLMIQNYVAQSQDIVFNPYGAQQLNLTDYLLVPFFGNCAVVLIMVMPALSMRLFAEELKQRTLELLMTSPVSTLEIVAGKFLGALAFVALMLLGTVQFPLGLLEWGTPDAGVVAGSYLGLLLLGASLLSLGMLASALTSNQIVASVTSFAVALGLLVVSWGSQDPHDWYAKVSILTHLEDLTRGAVKLSDLAYYVAFTGFFLFATHQRMESFPVALIADLLLVSGTVAAAAAVGLVAVVGDNPVSTALVGLAVALFGTGAGWRLVVQPGDKTKVIAEAATTAAALAGAATIGQAWGTDLAPVVREQATLGFFAVALVAGAVGRIVGGAAERAGNALGVVGLLLLALGACAAWIQGGFDGYPSWMAGAGGAGLVAFAVLERREVGATVTSRGFVFGSGAVVLTALAAMLGVGVYALADRNDHTWDLTKSRKFTLSEHALQVARSVDFDVKVTAFYRPSAPGRAAFADLIERFHEANPRIQVEWVDPLAEPLKASQAEITGDQGTVVLEAKDKKRRLEGEATEEQVVRELVMLSSDVEHQVCWSLGHGEPDPDDEQSEDGLGGIRSELENLNYKVVKTHIAQERVPRTCEILVVARPTTDFFPYERESVAAYVAEGGRALVMLDPGQEDDLAADLERYGVSVGNDVVLDMNLQNQLVGVNDPSLVVLSAENLGQHEITKNLAAAIVLPLARSVRANPDAQGVKVQDLLRTSHDAWGETDPQGDTLAPDPGTELVGEVPVMAVVEVEDPAKLGVAAPSTPAPGAAVETDAGRGVPPDFAPKPGGKLVVVGDSDFASNRFLLWGNNRDLFLNTIAWLAEEKNQIGERPPQGDTLEMSLTGSALLCVVSVVVVPGSAMALALIVLLRRRYL